MKLSDFDYHLPKNLIAQTPIEKRDNSKLLILDKQSGQITDKKFSNILDILWKNDVLVVNKTRVINARLKGFIKTKTNSKEKEVEIFLHKQISYNIWDCLVYPWKKLKIWTEVNLVAHSDKLIWKIKSISESWRIIEFNKWWIEFLNIIESVWDVPLPPYIKEKLKNKERYQTVYNENSWSVAAPTAWLHFTTDLLKKLETKWVKIEKVLLHVWLWTFKNVQTEDIRQHKMHKEYIELTKEVAKRLNKYKKEWKNIIAVWTTSVRVLESFSDNYWVLKYWKKETDIFIYPGYKWKFVNNIITNFHLPKSTLLMLVSSFVWKNNIKKAYTHAIKQKYRFFSFWDAMWIK